MPKVGKEDFDYSPEGIAQAEAYSDATGIPMSNAQDRSEQTYFDGGRVSGKLGTPSLIPQSPSPMMGGRGYDKGGVVVASSDRPSTRPPGRGGNKKRMAKPIAIRDKSGL